MVVAVLAVSMVQMVSDDEIDVIVVRNALVTARRTVDVVRRMFAALV
jgi:hypothetical protein